MPSRPLAALRALVGLCQRLAPTLTGRAVFRLFCIVPRARPLDARQRALLGGAATRLAEGEPGSVPVAGVTIATRRFPAPRIDGERRTVALVHGFTSRAAHLAAFVDPLNARGLDVLAIDLPAHGESTGRTIDLLRAVDAVLAVHARTGPWHGLVGHSFGGMIAATAIAGTIPDRSPLPVERLVLIAAPEDLVALFGGFGAIVGLDARAQAAMNAMVERLAGVPIDAFKGHRQLRPPAPDTLVLHARDDREVGFANAAAWARAGDHVRVEALDGLGHRRILYADETVRRSVAHLAG